MGTPVGLYLHELKDTILKAIPELIVKLDSKDTERAAFQSFSKQKTQQPNPGKATPSPRMSSKTVSGSVVFAKQPESLSDFILVTTLVTVQGG